MDDFCDCRIDFLERIARDEKTRMEDNRLQLKGKRAFFFNEEQ